jgi:hypothetical protein
MAELADAHDSGSCGATHAGSSPVIRTKMQTNRIAMRFVFICTRFLHEFFEFTRFYLKFQPLFLLVEGTDESIYSK